VEDHAKEL
jgi:hypothetical protein